jgi:tetrahydromethanopterin S-methyltransferase subunit G
MESTPSPDWHLEAIERRLETIDRRIDALDARMAQRFDTFLYALLEAGGICVFAVLVVGFVVTIAAHH